MTDGSSEAVALFPSERQRQIAALTHEQRRVEVSHLAEMFQVTTETIRRDLSDLQRKRLVRRVHGGAVPWERSDYEPSVAVRADRNDAEKRRIARRAVEELPDSGSIIIDSGSTLTRFAEAIPDGVGLQVVTNCLPVASTLAERTSLDLTLTGGTLTKNTLALVGQQAIAAVEPLTVDTLFISTDAANPQTGLTTPHHYEAAIKSAMIAAARRTVALVDHTKFGEDAFIRFAKWSQIDVLITTAEIEQATVDSIERTGVSVVLA